MVKQLIRKGMAVFLSCMVLASHVPGRHVVAAENEKSHITVKKSNTGTIYINNGNVGLFYRLTEHTSASKTEYMATIFNIFVENGEMQDVVIPKEFNDEIYADDGSGWFDFHATVEEVVLDGYPEKNIRSITLEDGIKEFGYYPGDVNPHPDLEILNIPKSVTTMCALNYCSNYESGFSKFNEYFQSLKEINIDEANPYYSSENGVLYDKSKKTLLKYPAAKEAECFNVPSGVKKIGGSAFTYSKNTKKVVLPNSVDTLEGCAFGISEGIEEVVLPKNNPKFDTISNSCFGDSNIKTVMIPDSVNTVGYMAFAYMHEMESLDLNKIEDYFGSGYYNDHNFSYCPKLKTLNLGNLDDLTACGINNLFYKDTALTQIIVSPNSKMIFRDGNLLKKMDGGYGLIYHLASQEAENGIYRIPSYIFYTFPHAFASNDKIEEYIIPSNLSISAALLEDTQNVPTVKYLGDSLDNLFNLTTFYNCKDNTRIQFANDALVNEFNANVSTYAYGFTPIVETFKKVPTTKLDITNTKTKFEKKDQTFITTTIEPLNATDSITYTSSNEKVATVNKAGQVTFNQSGKVTIQATAGEQTATKDFFVKGTIKDATITFDKTTVSIKNGVIEHPGITVSINGTDLTENVDYRLSYQNDDKVGIASVSIEGLELYQDTVTKEYRVTKEFDTDIDIEVTDQVWTGNQIKPQITVKDGDQPLNENTDYTIRYGENQKIGTGSVTITGIGNYSGTKSKNFNIIANGNTNLSDANANLVQTSFACTGSEIKPKVLVYSPASGELLVENKDYTLIYTNNTNPGTGHVNIVPAPNSNWNGSKGLDFEITKTIYNNVNVTLNQTSFTYNGSAFTPGVTVKNPNTGATLKQGTDYTVSYANHVNAGTGTVVVTATSNSEWQGSKTLYFTIHKAKLQEVHQTKTTTYKNAYQYPTVFVFSNHQLLTKNRDYKVTYLNHKNCGKAMIKITGINNYTGTITCTFDILPRKSSVRKITAKKRSMKVYVKSDNQGARKQIRYSYYSSMKKAKTVSIGTSKTIKKLKKGKKYYVQVRSYVKIDGKTYYSSWSSKKKSGKIK